MGELSHKAARIKQRYSSDPKNFAYAQTKVWDELSPMEKASSMFQEYTNKGAALAKEVGAGMKTAVTESAVTGMDVMERASPKEFGLNVNAGIKEVITGDKNVPASIRFQKGRAERQARPLRMERLTGQQLKNEDGTVNWDFARKFVGRAMEIPTYGYAGAVQGGSLVGKGLLTRLLTRTARSVPEAGVNTAIQTFEEGSTENWKTNMIANTLLMSGVSNIAGEVSFPKEVLNKTIGDIEGQVGKLTPEQKLDVQDALRQGVKSEDILTNLQKVVKNEVTPDEVAAKVNAAVESPKVETPEAKVETPDDPLLQEARKYKSAEEFVNSPNLYFRGDKGTPTPRDGMLMVSKDYYTASQYAQNLLGETTGEVRSILPKIEKPFNLPADIKKLPPDLRAKIYNGKDFDTRIESDRSILKEIKKLGYDAVNYDLGKTNKNFKGRGVTTILLDAEKQAQNLLTKSQLTDLWKKTQGGQSTKGTSPLLQEAGKYKSAEEFVKASIFSPARDSVARNTLRTEISKITEVRKADTLTPNPNNPSLDKSTINIKTEDITEGKRPYVLVDGDMIIDGHHAFEAYKKAGIEDIPVVTKSQLTDLWKKAHGETPKLESTPIIKETETPKEVKVSQSQMPVGTGKEKVSRLEARMTGNLGKLTPEQIDEIGLSTYNQMNKAEQIKAAAEYVTANPDNVIKILSGEMEPPKGLLKNSIYVAAENMAHDDANLARRLASLQSTRLGQELSILTEALEDSPVKAMREVSDARIQAVEKRLKSGSVSKTRNEITKKAKESVDKTVTKAIKEDWASFVNSIKCPS